MSPPRSSPTTAGQDAAAPPRPGASRWSWTSTGFRLRRIRPCLRLMNPSASSNAGGYTCEFSTPYSSHTERNKVTFSAGKGSPEKETSFWWIFGLLAGLLLLVLTGMFAFLKLRAKKQKTTNRSEEEAELNSVRASAAAAGQ
ncbi:hypothetical protein OJAV_G00181210 [Oryzias javanicus]|uniref:Uncharacterized protein n=1 Tax=Oryzias javanicus TaxID=123683 RepID=A0A3S2LSX7_ORYJA|nr:hypothetical protein OJAV_G00181210 [Oryzias javanicus]